MLVTNSVVLALPVESTAVPMLKEKILNKIGRRGSKRSSEARSEFSLVAR